MSSLLTGCLTPLNHPLRAEPGLFIGGGVGAGVGAGQQVNCHDGCNLPDMTSIGAGLSATAGLMAMPTREIGLIVGAEAGSNSQRGTFTYDGAVSAFAHGTWQTPTTALGLGMEAGGLMWGVKGSVHRKIDDEVAVAGWGRYLRPWTPDRGFREPDMWIDGRYPAMDVGVRLEWRRIAINYAFGTQFGGSSGQLWFIEGRVHDEYWYSVSFSFQLVLPWNSRAIQGDPPR